MMSQTSIARLLLRLLEIRVLLLLDLADNVGRVAAGVGAADVVVVPVRVVVLLRVAAAAMVISSSC
jgi:hypothetical protein